MHTRIRKSTLNGVRSLHKIMPWLFVRARLASLTKIRSGVLIAWILANAAYMGAYGFYVATINSSLDSTLEAIFMYMALSSIGMISSGGFVGVYILFDKVFTQRLKGWQRQLTLLGIATLGNFILTFVILLLVDFLIPA